MEGAQGVGIGGASSPSTAGRPGTSYSKRKRSGLEFESSPGTGGEGDDDEGEKKRLPGVKRACNECRQQKVSHHGNSFVKILKTVLWLKMSGKLTQKFYSYAAMSSKILLPVVHVVIDCD